MIGDMGDPQKVMAAAKPVFDEEEEKIIAAGKEMLDHAVDRAKAELIPALQQALTSTFDGLVITISISKKETPTT
jgi:hypothetical protein